VGGKSNHRDSAIAAHTPNQAPKPGSEAPLQLNQALPEKEGRSSMSDKIQTGSNLAMAAGSVFPLLQHHGGDKGAKHPGTQDDLKIEDRQLYNQMKVSTTVGPPSVNW
jgi:hypothetical protein